MLDVGCSAQAEGRIIEGTDSKIGGQILQASSGSGSSKQTFSYSTDRIVGNGSFGVVFQATCLETGETVSVVTWAICSLGSLIWRRDRSCKNSIKKALQPDRSP